jgi:hypothetical protein
MPSPRIGRGRRGGLRCLKDLNDRGGSKTEGGGEGGAGTETKIFREGVGDGESGMGAEGMGG